MSKIPILQDYLNEHFTNPDIVPELKLVIKIKIKNSKNYYEDMFIRQEPIWADRDTITHQFLYPNYHEAEIILKQTLLLDQDKEREGIEITYHPFSDYGNSRFTMLNFTRMEEKWRLVSREMLETEVLEKGMVRSRLCIDKNAEDFPNDIVIINNQMIYDFLPRSCFERIYD